MYECKLICQEEFADRVSCAKMAGRKSLDFIDTGFMWFSPVFYDHQDPDLEQYRFALIKRARSNAASMPLSLHYYRDWALVRDPVSIMLPTGLVCLLDGSGGPAHGARLFGYPPYVTANNLLIDRGHRFRLTDGCLFPTKARAK